MRVVSLVPSLTETLLEAGVDVVGRTRFCIHGPGVSSIRAVGGTKDWDWPLIKSLKPDLLVLDKEENPKFMSEQQEVPFVATHVCSVQDMPQTMSRLGAVLEAPRLLEGALQWEKIVKEKFVFPELPGLLEWGRRGEYREVLYIIWKDPWMAVGRKTFIGSMLELCGLSLAPVEGSYPQVDLTHFDEDTLLMLSSEPYPFMKKKSQFQFSQPYAFVDGESFSWFGVRALRFLQGCQNSPRC